jgi:hypothetical protein
MTTVDVERDVQNSTIRVDCLNVGNAATKSKLKIVEGELIDEVLDVAGAIQASEVVINMHDSGNSYCHPSSSWPHIIDITAGELVDSVFDVLEVTHNSRIRVNLFDVANAHTRTEREYIRLRASPIDGSKSVLMDPIIDESTGNCLASSSTTPQMCWTNATNAGKIKGGC